MQRFVERQIVKNKQSKTRAAFDASRRADHRHHAIWLNGQRYENDRAFVLNLTPIGSSSSNKALRPHCHKCVAGATVVNFQWIGEGPVGQGWTKLEIIPRYSTCPRGYARSVTCRRDMHTSWFELENDTDE